MSVMENVVETSLEINKWFDVIDANDIGFDLTITDPPYPFDNKNGSGRHSYVDGKDEMYTRMSWGLLGVVFNRLLNCTKEGGRIYVFTNRDGYEQMRGLLIDVGWRYLNTLVWDKMRFGGGYHWRNSVEYIHYFCKPKKPKVLIKGARNVLAYKKPTKSCSIPEVGYFPALNASPKPNEIWRDILIHGAADGDVVCDPFAGSNPLKTALFLNPELQEKIGGAYTNAFDV